MTVKRPGFLIFGLLIGLGVAFVVGFYLKPTTNVAPPPPDASPTAQSKIGEPQSGSGAGPEPKPESTALPAKSSQSEEPKTLTVEEFQRMSQGVLTRLPHVSDLHKLGSEEVHHTPQIIRQAGLQIGKIAQAVHDNSKLSEEGIKFYRQCATQADGATSVRALCFAQLRNLEIHQGQSVDTENIPEAVQKLSKNIPVEEP